jgi:hypothetical protein
MNYQLNGLKKFYKITVGEISESLVFVKHK